MKTRDIRSLGGYIAHFKKYNREVKHDKSLSLGTIGMIEDIDGELLFVPVLYNGRKFTKLTF